MKALEILNFNILFIWYQEMMEGPKCEMQDLPQIPPQILLLLNISILSNPNAKHMNSLWKIILIFTIFNRPCKQSCKISPIALSKPRARELLGGGRFLQPCPSSHSQPLSLPVFRHGQCLGVPGVSSQRVRPSLPPSVFLLLQRWPGRGSLLGLPWATLPAANRNLQQC